VARRKKQKAEKTKQQKCIEDLGGFTFTIITHFSVCSVPVIQGQK
jgi:hypothetical protein